MVPNYYRIQNGDLRMLVIASESIHSLPPEEIIQMVDHIADLSPQGVQEMIRVLEDEQKQIKAAKLAKGITIETEIRNYQEKKSKIGALLHNAQSQVRQHRENTSYTQDLQMAEASLNNL